MRLPEEGKDTTDMAPFISTTVQWVILPLIMLAIFAFAWIIASSARTPELKVSSWAGFWAGLVTFVVYVVSHLREIREPDLHVATLPGLDLLSLGFGLAVGFVFLWAVRNAVPTRLVGLITLMLSASSTTAVFTYIFINSLHVSVLYWTLGAALGILMHIVFFPSSIEYIFKGSASARRFLIDATRIQRPEAPSPAGAMSTAAEGLANQRYDSQAVPAS